MNGSATSPAVARTPGATRAVAGEYVFEMAKVNHLMGGPDYSTVHGSCVEGDRMIAALMRMPAGTGADLHSHLNEQWIYVIEGTMQGEIGGTPVTASAGTALYIPAEVLHTLKATDIADVMFFTVKDASHSLHGTKYAANL